MNIFRDREAKTLGRFFVFGVTDEGIVRSGVDWSAPLRQVFAAESLVDVDVSYRVMHHAGGNAWINQFVGSVYSAAAFLLVCLHHDRSRTEDSKTAYILLEVEPGREWKSCERQMVRAASLLAGAGRLSDVIARYQSRHRSTADSPDPKPAAKPLPDLRGFWRDLVRYFGPDEHLELDGFAFEEMALKHNLVRNEPFDPDVHGNVEAEPGDIIWVDNLAEGKHA